MSSDRSPRGTPDLRAEITEGALWKSTLRATSAVVAVAGQFILGWLLSEDDYGVYAIAISAGLLIRAIQDGGVSLVLMRLTPGEFREHANTGLAISTASSILVSAVLVALSGPVAAFYGEPEVQQLLWVLAIAAPLTSVWPVAVAGLHGSMAFRSVAIIEFLAASLQTASTVTLALLGFGPFSFVIPVAIVGAFNSVGGWLLLRRAGLTPQPGLVAGREFLRRSPWAVAGTWGTFLYLNVDNLILGRIVSTATLGYYYFAYQIVRKVLSPFDSLWGIAIAGFATLSDDGDRTRRAVVTAGLVAGGLAAPIFMVVAVTAGPLINLIWSGKWDQASGSVASLALVSAAVLFVKLAETLVQARARFATWTAIVIIRAIVVGLGAGVGAMLVRGDNPTPAAVVIAAAILIGSLAMVAFACRSVSVASASALRAFAAPFTFALVGGLLLICLETALTLDPLPMLLAASVGALAWLQMGHLLILRVTSKQLRSLFGDRRLFRWLGYLYGFGWAP